ncbi:MAG: HAMP domain-containing protein [Proteobacteria bacterium]|nr:HAMP domain-containing protein [Pseudomonadota bacterium]NOG59010.1 HAMP domain-containing protein [Pseudomonadota bacterium]
MVIGLVFSDNTTMKLSLHKKLVLAILLSISSVIVIMLLLMSWSFDRGFKAHVLAEEERNDKLLIESLVDRYKTSGDWTFLQDKPSLWDEFIFSSHRKPKRRPERFEEGSRPPKPPGFSGDRHPPRLPKPERVLLDPDKQVIIGDIKFNQLDDYSLKPILLDGQTIGFLAREPFEKSINPRQQKFMRHLQKLFFLIAGSAIAVAIIIAWVLSRNLLKPIQRISDGTTALAAGNYETRIDVTSKDELGELSRHFNLLAKTLEKNEHSRKQWIADISHELRTPLSILRGEIEALIDGVRTMDDSRLQSLHQEVVHLNQLIDDLHELSLSDIGALNYEMESQDIIGILNQSIDTLQIVADKKSIQLDKEEIIKEQIYVLCDSRRVQQLFTNIVMNSLTYTNAPGTLKVKVTTDNNSITIDFMDSSPGVTEEESPKLFDRLYRADSSRNRKSGGSGLGLSICHNIVEAHDGGISAKASPLGGLWISISFPLPVS